MMQNPSPKYRPFSPVRGFDRQWPNQVVGKPPIWMSTDLRDGNQATIPESYLPRDYKTPVFEIREVNSPLPKRAESPTSGEET